MKFILLLIASLFLVTGCNEKVIVDDSSDFIEKTKEEIDVFSDVKLSDIYKVKDNSLKIISDDEKIDTEKLGEKSFEIVYSKEDKKYSKKISVKIVDKEAPRVIGGINKSVVKGYEGDLCNIITYGDNYDGFINCKIEGDYNLYNTGTYNLKYTLSDSSDNKKEVNVVLNVIEKNNSSSSSSNPPAKVYFSDVVNNYKSDNVEFGIDVSKWQGDIDFNKVKSSGASFVIMRIGVQSSLGGELSVDRYYEQNIKKAKEAGLKVGVYLYSMASSREEAKEHAEWVVKTLNNESLDLPIVFDWENWSKWNSFKISFHEINEIANTYMNTAKEAGYEGMLYSSKFYLENIWENKLEYPVWLAHYTSKTSYSGKYKIWQMCNTGRIDGINGDVDIDIMYN